IVQDKVQYSLLQVLKNPPDGLQERLPALCPFPEAVHNRVGKILPYLLEIGEDFLRLFGFPASLNQFGTRGHLSVDVYVIQALFPEFPLQLNQLESILYILQRELREKGLNNVNINAEV